MKTLKEKIEHEVERLGFYLYDMTLGPRGKDKVLSVKIDHENPITIDDCVKVSEHLSEFLDKEDPIESAYMLEVTSAGAEADLRTFEEMKRALHKLVYVKTFDQEFKGTLEKVTETSIEVKDEKKRTTIFIADIEKIRLAIDF